MSNHPSPPEIDRLLPTSGSEEARLFAHVLICEACREHALGVLKAPHTSLHAQFLACFEQVDGHLDRVEELLNEILDPTEEGV